MKTYGRPRGIFDHNPSCSKQYPKFRNNPTDKRVDKAMKTKSRRNAKNEINKYMK